jgi:phosphoglycolate phosphatase
MCNRVKKLVLFDLDGVILDSKINMELSWNEVCKEHNLSIKFEDYFSKIGRPFKDILDILGIKEGQDDIEKTFNETSIRLLDIVTFYNGVELVLNKLSGSGIKTGIVTSKNTLKTSKILELLNFEFDIVQTPNNELQGKPEPDHILHAISELNMTAGDTLYIGDMDVDYQAAKSAKVDYIHALWGYGACDSRNVIKIKKITHLMEFI